MQNRIGRQVRITSISFNDRSLEEIADFVDCEGAKGCDLIALPETWRGAAVIEDLNGETIRAMSALAKKHRTYIISPMYRKSEEIKRINSAVLLDRNGNIACVYDKVYPYWEEFYLDPPTQIGCNVKVFDTDFGKIGMAICFDANFPVVWEKMAQQEAELVIWTSAYSAGTSLQAHAINHNYNIVTSTLCSDCTHYDITGQEIFYEKSEGINISRLKIDLDRCIFHENYNIEKRDRLLADYKGKVVQELFMEREQWFVLKATEPGVSVRSLAKGYNMEELGSYKRRSEQQIDKMREESNTK